MQFSKTTISVLAFVCGVCAATDAAQADVLHVPGDFPTIQSAVDAAMDGDEVEVHPGTYFECINLLGKAITLGSSDGLEVTIIDAGGVGGCGLVVTCDSGEGPDTVLEGFTITGGNHTIGGGMFNGANSNPTVTNCTFTGNSAIFRGGGMYNFDSSPTVTDCTFSSNMANGGGGGMYNLNSSPTVTDCTFNSNTAYDGGGGMYNLNSSPTVTNCTFNSNTDQLAGGGGMYNEFDSSPTVINCMFSGNSTEIGGSSGGGMFNGANSNPTVTNCTFTGNSAIFGWGGGMFNQYSSSPAVTNCTFSSNTAGSGGGGMRNVSSSNPTVTNCTFSSNTGGDGGGMFNVSSSPMLTNCTFSSNMVNGYGGGMYNGGSNPAVINCTFTGNSAIFGWGGGMYNFASSPTVTDCILWGDSPDEIVVFDGDPTVTFSNVQGGWPGTGNIDADPLFVAPGMGDSHLSSSSPCIDAADNTAVPEGIVTDLDGNPRFVDDPNTDDTGFGDPPIVDMGAYEFQVLIADLDLKPGACPNPFNRHGNGVLPVALVGTVEFDPSEVDLSTLQLSRADGVGGSVAPNEGPPGPHSMIKDAARPFDGEPCDCQHHGPDGVDDLSMKFRTDELVEALELDALPGGSMVELVLSGNMLDGTTFAARDCIMILPPSAGGPINATMGSNVGDTFIEVTPLDLNIDSDGFASFGRAYYPGTLLTVTAPPTSEGRRFVRWMVDGVLQEVGVRTIEVTVAEDTTLQALYRGQKRLLPDRPTESDEPLD